MVKLFYAFFGALIISNCYAVSITEIQEVRLSKAELAMADGKEKLALRLISSNLNSKYIHMESFQFLAKYHFLKGNIPKAFKVYYYLIKRLHIKDVLRLKYDDRFLENVADLKVPSKKALEIYFTTAKAYYNLNEEGLYDKSFSQHLFLLANKYFEYCSFYRYKLPTVKLYIAQIKARQEKNQEAVEKFIEARELFQQQSPGNKKKIEEVELMLGEALIKDGFSDAGSLYLKSIFLNKQATPALRQYANAYLDALGSTYASISFSYAAKYNNNIHDLNDSELSNFERDSKSTLFKKEGSTHQKNLNIFYSKKIADHWSGIGIFNFLDEVAADNQLKSKDVRSYSAGVDLKYDNLIKSLIKLKYNWSTLYLKSSNEGKLSKSSTTHSFEGQYIHTLKKGTITYGLPYSVTTSSDNEITGSIGLSVAYTPFWHSKFFSPSYELEYSKVEEGTNLSASTQSIFSLSNHSALNDRNSIFLSADFTFNANAEADLGYKEQSYIATYSYLFKFLDGLTANFEIIRNDKNQDDGNHIGNWEASAGLSYTF